MHLRAPPLRRNPTQLTEPVDVDTGATPDDVAIENEGVVAAGGSQRGNLRRIVPATRRTTPTPPSSPSLLPLPHHRRQSTSQRRNRSSFTLASRHTSTTPPSPPTSLPLAPRRGRKREIEFQSDDSTDSEVVRSPSCITLFCAPFTPPPSQTYPKRRRIQFGVLDHTLARALSPSASRGLRRQRFEELRRTMDKNDGRTLVHYEGQAQAAAAAAEFSIRKGSTPHLIAANETGTWSRGGDGDAALGGKES